MENNNKINFKHVSIGDYIVFANKEQDYDSTLWKILDIDIKNCSAKVQGYSGKKRYLPLTEAIRYGDPAEINTYHKLVKVYRKAREYRFELEEMLNFLT